MNKLLLLSAISIGFVSTSCQAGNTETSSNKEVVAPAKSKTELPGTIKVNGIAQNPEGVEYDKSDQTFLLSSLNAGPIIKVNPDGTYKPFTTGEPYPMSTAGLHIDYKNNRLLVAAFNGTELFDQDPATKGVSNLRIYNLKTGAMEKDINLSSLVPDAPAYFANDVAVDNEGNAYVTDWYAGVVYKVDMNGTTSVFWKNETGIPSGTNGIDFHPDGYLLVSLVSVNEKGLYANYGLVKIPVNKPKSAKLVEISNAGFTGFDGMVIKENGNVVGVTNNGTTPGGNTLIELSSKNNWESAKVINSKPMAASTTVAVTEESENYVINQDFTQPMKENWTINLIKF
jgi:sugar lactone lactonase YvrE